MKRNEYELCYKIFKNKIKRTLLQEIVKGMNDSISGRNIRNKY